MAEPPAILVRVREAAQKRRLFLSHAVRQMARPDRMITTAEVRSVIDQGEVIEDGPDGPRGHSCLILGHGHGGRPIDGVCLAKDEFLAIITAYLPDPDEWSTDFGTRATRQNAFIAKAR